MSIGVMNESGDDDAIRARLRLLESVVVHANDAVLITEAEPIELPGPRIVYVNPAFTRMTGFTSTEVLGRTPRLLHGPETSAAARAQIRAALKRWEPITIELLNYRRDGTPFWVEQSITPVRDETGYFTHWVSVQRDITARRRAQETAIRERIAAAEQLTISKESLQRERIEDQLARSAMHDVLTGLHNRPHFMTCIERAIARMGVDPRSSYGLITIDLCRFRDINDQLGYGTGDQILCEIARRLEACVGPLDTLARIGGDEFAILFTGSLDRTDGRAMADRALLACTAIPQLDARDRVIEATIGLVPALTGYVDAHSALRDVNTARLVGRQRHGSVVITFTAEMRDEADTALRLRHDLYGALTRDELRLYFQPLVDIALGRIYGFEALIRWEHPQRGLVSPADFIPIAELTGLIIDIGRWVLVTGCRMARELTTWAGYPIVMSVNVSSQQLLHPGFLDDLVAAVEESGIDPGSLQLEITESIFVGSAELVGGLFARIRELGVRIALDDFGTGYSSLSYLERFQIDTLKIDQSFVARINGPSAKSEIVRLIITLAHSLGVDVVAEGVETRAQRNALGDLGCTHLQGYLFSRPLPVDAARRLFDGNTETFAAIRGLLAETLSDTAIRLSLGAREELHAQVCAAFDTHFAWMDRLATAVATGVSPFDLSEVAREDRCPIGQWLNSEIHADLRRMPLYFVTKSRHAAFHRSMARLLGAVVAGDPSVALSLRRDGDVAMAAMSLIRTLEDWLTIADGSPDDSADVARCELVGGSPLTLPT